MLTFWNHIMWTQHLSCGRHLYHSTSGILADSKAHCFVLLVENRIIILKEAETKDPVLSLVNENFQFAISFGLCMKNSFDVALLGNKVLLAIDMQRQVRIIFYVVESRRSTDDDLLVKETFQMLGLKLVDELNAVLFIHSKERSSTIDDNITLFTQC